MAEKNLGGRPRKPFDLSKAEKDAADFCTAEEIAALQSISVDTLELRIKEAGYSGFTEFFKKYSAPARQSLRRKQYKLAQKGNVALLIWLGKQYLEQTDRMDTNNTNLNANVDFKIGFEDETTPDEPTKE